MAQADLGEREGRVPSYTTVRRLMKERGLVRQKRRQRRGPEDLTPHDHSRENFEARETRSYESAYVHGLWHLDFHGAKFVRIVLSNGKVVTPKLLGIVDDRSRLCCHAQWYLDETAEALVHGLSQAIQKRRRPQQLLTDNGAAMTAGEVREGLARLGILHERTLPACPEQTGKQAHSAAWPRRRSAGEVRRRPRSRWDRPAGAGTRRVAGVPPSADDARSWPIDAVLALNEPTSYAGTATSALSVIAAIQAEHQRHCDALTALGTQLAALVDNLGAQAHVHLRPLEPYRQRVEACLYPPVTPPS